MKKCIVFLVALMFIGLATASSAFALWDKPCNHKKVLKHFWCEACGKVSEFPDCKGAEYIWDYKDYKAGEGKYGESVKHQNLPHGWACEKIQFMCNNDKCEMYQKCTPSPGICRVCGEDFQSNAVLSRVLFKCTGCGKEHEEPGTGHKLLEGSYLERIVSPGNCPDDGKPLEVVCTLSGTCPHISR